jgi:uncharacterized protein
MDAKLLAILACPLCKGPLHYQRTQAELLCTFDRVAYPVQKGIPVMLASAARILTDAEVTQLKGSG